MSHVPRHAHHSHEFPLHWLALSVSELCMHVGSMKKAEPGVIVTQSVKGERTRVSGVLERAWGGGDGW